MEETPVYNTGAASAEMPRFISCKVVHALKIATITVSDDPQVRVLHFEDRAYAPRAMTTDWVNKRGAKAGGYFISYEDGYTSWAPADVFERGNVPAADWGIPRPQEPKYGTDRRGRLVNRHSGKPIPDDEPVFVIRGQDINALQTIAYYRSLLSPGTGAMESLDERILAFSHFRERFPGRVKHPDSKVPPPPVPHSINKSSGQAPRTEERPRASGWPFPKRD